MCAYVVIKVCEGVRKLFGPLVCENWRDVKGI